MLTITGGKLTTFRRMAAQVVDRIVERDGREADAVPTTSHSGWRPVADDLATGLELPDGAADQLAFRYGHAAARSSTSARSARSSLADRAGHPDLLAEVVIAARREQARSVADVLLRRTRLGLLAAPELRDETSRGGGADAREGARLERRGSPARRRPGARSPTPRASIRARDSRSRRRSGLHCADRRARDSANRVLE